MTQFRLVPCLLGLLGAVGLTLAASALLVIPWWASLAGLSAAALLAACLVSPFFGLCATAFTLIIATANLFYLVVGTLQLHFYPYYFPLFCTCLGMLARAGQKRLSLSPRSAFWPVLLLVLAGETVTILWTPHPGWGLANIFRLILNLLLYAAILVLCDSRRRLDLLLKTVLASALMTSIGVIAAMYYELDLHRYLTSRWALELHLYTIRAGGIESWNQSAGLLSVASFIAAGYAVLARARLARVLWALASMYFFCTMLLPASRGALLGFMGAAMLLLVALPATRRIFIRKSTLFVILVIAGMLITTPGYIDRMLVGFGYTGELLFSKKKSSTSSSSDATGLSTRFKIWAKGFRAMGAEPDTVVGGLGAGGFTYKVDVFEVHNIYLAYYYDMGLVGLFLLAFFCFIFLGRTVPVYHAFQARLLLPPGTGEATGRDFVLVMFYAVLTALVAEVAVHGIVDYDLTSFVSRYAFFYLGLYDVVLRLARQRLDGPGFAAVPLSGRPLVAARPA
ncbi:MAG: O-antigen ligase family protein [Acidobacteriota bacterium]